jgi:hypothetical protein
MAHTSVARRLRRTDRPVISRHPARRVRDASSARAGRVKTRPRREHDARNPSKTEKPKQDARGTQRCDVVRAATVVFSTHVVATERHFAYPFRESRSGKMGQDAMQVSVRPPSLGDVRRQACEQGCARTSGQGHQGRRGVKNPPRAVGETGQVDRPLSMKERAKPARHEASVLAKERSKNDPRTIQIHGEDEGTPTRSQRAGEDSSQE